MLAAGNSVIIIPHPRCAGVSGYTAKHIDEAIYSACGIRNLVLSVPQSSMRLADELMWHPDVSMIVATGSERMIRHALTSAKRVIGAGAANPVAMVDETADIKQAARNIVDGASFDHNIMCISEKNIVAVSSIADELIKELKAQGALFISDPEDMLKLTKATVDSNLLMKRSQAGRSPGEILKAADIQCDRDVRLIVVETVKTHPFVTLEMLMPLVPLLRARDFDEMLETALFIEQGHRHTATIHSQSIARLNKAAQVMQTSVFVKNGSSLSSIGFDGESGTSFTIANVTGEGVTTARDFARKRRCSLMTGLSIR
jgi:propionaldehyde dehydrogenase